MVIAGLVFVQSDVRAVVEYMRETFVVTEPRLVETADVADLSLQDPAQLLRPREGCKQSDSDEGCCSAHASRATGSCAALDSNPLQLPTEREVHSADKGKEVYRFMLQKRQ